MPASRRDHIPTRKPSGPRALHIRKESQKSPNQTVSKPLTLVRVRVQVWRFSRFPRSESRLHGTGIPMVYRLSCTLTGHTSDVRRPFTILRSVDRLTLNTQYTNWLGPSSRLAHSVSCSLRI
jgi:hypothetical protein